MRNHHVTDMGELNITRFKISKEAKKEFVEPGHIDLGIPPRPSRCHFWAVPGTFFVTQRRAPYLMLISDNRAELRLSYFVRYDISLKPEKGLVPAYIDQRGAAKTAIDLAQRAPLITNFLRCTMWRHFAEPGRGMGGKPPYTSNRTTF